MMKKIIILVIILMCCVSVTYAKCGIDHDSGGTDRSYDETADDEERGLFKDKPLRSRDLKLKDGYETEGITPQQPLTPKRKPKYGVDPSSFKLRDEEDEPPNVAIPKDKHRTIVVAPCDCDTVNCGCPESKAVCTEVSTCADKNCGTDGPVHKCRCVEKFCSEGEFTPPCGGTHLCTCEGSLSADPCPPERCLPICSEKVGGSWLSSSDCGGARSCRCLGKGSWCKVCGTEELCRKKGLNRPCREDKYRKEECNCGCGFNDCRCKKGRKCRNQSKEIYCGCSRGLDLWKFAGTEPAVKCSCKTLIHCSTSSLKDYLPCRGKVRCARIGCKAGHCTSGSVFGKGPTATCRMVCPSTKTDSSELTCGGHKKECDCVAAKNPDPGAAKCDCGTSCLGCSLVPCCDKDKKYKCRCMRVWFGLAGECKNCADLGATCSSNVARGGTWHHCPVSGLGSCAE